MNPLAIARYPFLPPPGDLGQWIAGDPVVAPPAWVLTCDEVVVVGEPPNRVRRTSGDRPGGRLGTLTLIRIPGGRGALSRRKEASRAAKPAASE